MLLMTLLPGKRHFARTKAAMEAKMHCAIVTVAVTKILLKTYLENGTRFW